MSRKRNVANRQAWIAALRSGRYRQTRGVLFRKEPSWGGAPAGYCCLGVACRLGGVKRNAMEGVSDPEGLSTAATDFNFEKWLGVSPNSDLMTYAINWNDDERLTFKEIADRLEERLLKPEERLLAPHARG